MKTHDKTSSDETNSELEFSTVKEEDLTTEKNVKEVYTSRITDAIFVEYLRKYGRVLFSRSKTSKISVEKGIACNKICEKLLMDEGVQYSAHKITKKVQNFKAKVARSMNKNVKLSAAEKEFVELMDAADELATNPSQGNIDFPPNKYVNSVWEDSNDIRDDDSRDLVLHDKRRKSTLSSSPASPALPLGTPLPSTQSQTGARRKLPSAALVEASEFQYESTFNNLETIETIDLSNEQLERYVLLRQLKLFEKQERVTEKQEMLAVLQIKAQRNKSWNK